MYIYRLFTIVLNRSRSLIDFESVALHAGLVLGNDIVTLAAVLAVEQNTFVSGRLFISAYAARFNLYNIQLEPKLFIRPVIYLLFSVMAVWLVATNNPVRIY